VSVAALAMGSPDRTRWGGLEDPKLNDQGSGLSLKVHSQRAGLVPRRFLTPCHI